MNKVKILVIGLGSMGKRRIRNLIAIGNVEIIGFDPRSDRRIAAEKTYSIKTIDYVSSSIDVDAFIISTPPDVHHIYMKMAIELKKPAFVEASVVDTDYQEVINNAKNCNVFIAPSTTFYFHPAIKLIFEIINSNKIGKITNVIYHSGQYLPDWHTYEEVNEYYVSKKETGGAREIVPFELTWLTKLFGFPKNITAMVKKTIDIKGAEFIDDTYNILFDYDSFIINLIVDVVSRYPTRKLLINGENGQLTWNWDDNFVKIYSVIENAWKEIKYDTLPAHDGYNKNITEQMYIEELTSFLNAAFNKKEYPNSLENDLEILHLLYKAESSSANKNFK